MDETKNEIFEHKTQMKVYGPSKERVASRLVAALFR
jgi:hypothetical protein